MALNVLNSLSSNVAQAFVVFILAMVARDVISNPIIAVGESGASAQFRSEDNLGNYNFGYNEDHTSGGTFRREAGDAHGNVAGSYGLRDADGRIRIVNYIANDDGFKADIQTNEPGVEPKDTADASFNKAASVVVETVAPYVAASAPVVAIPAAEPVAYRAESYEVASPVFPPVSAVPVAKTVAQPVAYSFPEPAAVPVAKTISTPLSAVAEPAALTYAFPAPAAVPVAKSSTTTITTEAKPAVYAFPAPAAVPVAKSSTTTITTEARPAHYAFPAPAAVPVAKSIAAPVAVAPATYAFPAPAAVPVAKSSTTITSEARPISYAFPAPAAVPVAKSSTTTITTEAKPVAYAFPQPAAVPVAKSIAAPVAVAPATYAFPAPAAVPVAKSSSLHYAAEPIATAPLAYAAAPASKFSYSTHVVNNAPAHYAVKTSEVKYGPAAVAYAPALRYTINPHLSAFRYATPYYKSLYSPVVASFAGPVPYFNNIEYHGYPLIKK